MAIRLNPETEDDRRLLRRAGYGPQGFYVLLVKLLGDEVRCEHDPYKWGDRTMHNAHVWILEHWSQVSTGQVVDVEYILGETESPKLPEQATFFLNP